MFERSAAAHVETRLVLEQTQVDLSQAKARMAETKAGLDQLHVKIADAITEVAQYSNAIQAESGGTSAEVVVAPPPSNTPCPQVTCDGSS